MTDPLLSALHADLLAHADENTRQGFHRFFKEEVQGYGVKSAAVGEIAKQYFDCVRDREKQEIWDLCETLLESDYIEDAFIAFDWAYRLRSRYTPEDFDVFERWIARYVNNWAKCDTLCNHAVGAFLEKFPVFIDRLKGWTALGNRWFRRAATVSLILPARRGLFVTDILDIADRLLSDKDDLVQKGYGWMLKEASKRHPAEIFAYVLAHKREMPRTALRYAIEKMPEEWKRRAMEK
ncbi:MAG: DNA alkylation repair protein [Methanomicrobiales archaeon]|nr:DNA alkylation repair protein [Methanomicrobiales archaeon]